MDSEQINRQVNDFIGDEIEKRVNAWLVAAKGTDWAKFLDDTLKERAALIERVKALSVALQMLLMRDEEAMRRDPDHDTMTCTQPGCLIARQTLERHGWKDEG
jgi:hypothetical protein